MIDNFTRLLQLTYNNNNNNRKMFKLKPFLVLCTTFTQSALRTKIIYFLLIRYRIWNLQNKNSRLLLMIRIRNLIIKKKLYAVFYIVLQFVLYKVYINVEL